MRTLAILFLFVTTTSLVAQEQLGLRVDNYAGVNALLLNPAKSTTSPFKWDLNIVAAGVFFETSYAHIQESNLFHTIKNAEKFELLEGLEGAPDQNAATALILDFNKKNRKKYLTVQANVMGPSAFATFNNTFSIGFISNLRTMLSFQNIPKEMGFYEFENTVLGEAFEVNKFKIAGAVWSEFGLHFGHRIETTNGMIGIGINVKALNAYEGFYFHNQEKFEMTRVTNDTLINTQANFNLGFTTSNFEGTNPRRSRNGGGYGFDLGFEYTEGDDDEYVYKIGASILDLGVLHFSRNAQRHTYNSNSRHSLPTRDYRNPDEPDDILSAVSEDILADSLASKEASSFKMVLPTALSIQGDYTIIPMVHVNALLIQHIPLPGAALERGNLLAVTPRFEHRWIGASVPVSLYNYEELNVGLALRLAYLTIGSDNLGSLFGKSDFTGSDFYVALKFNPFNVNWNLSFQGGGRGKNVKCYDF